MPYYGTGGDDTLDENSELNFIDYYGNGGRDLLLFGNKTGDPIGLWSVYIEGGTGNDVLSGNISGDELYGGRDNDIAYGNGGDDQVYGGSGDDALTGNDGFDQLSGGFGNDYLSGGNDEDSLDGGFGNDTLDGGSGGRDFIDGGQGFDLVTYESAPGAVGVDLQNSNNNFGDAQGDQFFSIEAFLGTQLADVFSGDALNNQFNASGGDDKLNGRGGNDFIFAGNGTDTVFGGDGNDNIDGEFGNDIIIGGKGNDYMTGGDGNDRFRFLAVTDSSPFAGGRDQIVDFTAGDKIDVAAIDTHANLPGDQKFKLDAGGTFAIGEIRQSEVGGDLILRFNTTGDAAPEISIIVYGVTAPLDAGDFIL